MVGIPTAMRSVAFVRRQDEMSRRCWDFALSWVHGLRAIVKQSATCRLLMSVPGIGALSVLAYVSTIEDPTRFCPITIGRSAPGTDADAISVGRERSQRQDLPLRHNLAPR